MNGLFASSSSPMGMALFWILALVVAVVAVVGLWKVFVKAGQPGWAAIIPIYNVYTLLKIAGRPGWWILLFLVPVVNWVVSIVVSIDVAKAFGKDAVFGVVGLWLFSVVGYLILGYGDATYKGSSAPTATPPASTAV